MTTSNEAVNGNGDAKPVIITDKILQLPKEQRLYINSDELGDYAGMGLSIYEGPRQGEYVDRSLLDDKGKPTKVLFDYKQYHYVDARMHWIKQHIKQYPTKSTGPLIFRNKETGRMQTVELNDLHPVPNHSPNLHRYTRDGKVEYLPAGIAYQDSQGNKISPDKDERGKPIIIQQNQARILNAYGGKKIPRNATDVFVAGTAESSIQAVYRNAKGNQQVIFSPEETTRRKKIHWENQTKARKSADGLIDELSADIDNIDNWSESDQVLLLIGRMGFRHGGDTIRRLPANEKEKENVDYKKYTGERTGIGASSLNTNEVSIQDDGSVRFQFLGKSNIPHDHVSTDPLVKRIIQQALRGKQSGDQLFPRANTKTNIARLRKLTGNDRMEIKDIRTYIGTSIARDLIKQELATRGGRTTTAKEFEEAAQRISLGVGKVLGHKRGVKDKDTGEVTYEDIGSTARKYYIDPVIWEDLVPEGAITKLLKMVKDLQTLSKVLPTGGMYSSRFAPPPGTKIYYTEREEGVGVPYWFPEGKDEKDWNDLTPEEQEAFMQADVNARYGKEEEDKPSVEEDEKDFEDMTSEERRAYIEQDEDMAAAMRLLQGIEPEDIKEAEEEISEVLDPEIDYDQLAEDEKKYFEEAVDRFASRGETYEEALRNPESAEYKERQAIKEFLEDKVSWESEAGFLPNVLPNGDNTEYQNMWDWIDSNPEAIKKAQEDFYSSLSGLRYPDNDGVSIPMHHLALLQKVTMTPFRVLKLDNIEGLVKTGRMVLQVKYNDPDGWKRLLELNPSLEVILPDEELETLLDKIESKADDNGVIRFNYDDRKGDRRVLSLNAMATMVEAIEGSPSKLGELLGTYNHANRSMNLTNVAREQGQEIDDRQHSVTAVHELAHAVHEDLPLTTRVQISAEYLRALETNSGFISNYAKGENEHEFFAESYAAYVLDTKLFRERNPSMADMMEKIFQEEPSTARRATEDEATLERLMEYGREVQPITSRIRELQNKGKHLEPLQEPKFLPNMLKEADKRVYEVDPYKIALWSPKAANLSRSTKSTLQKASVLFLKAKGKYKGRTGGITPDWTMKVPGEERDIDEWAEARRKKAEERQWGIKPVGGQHMAKTWIGSLADKGFTYPLIKQVIGSQMWFAQDGIDYIANLGINENELVTSVEKATFTYNKPSVSYAPSGRNNHNSKRKSSGMQGERYQGDIIDDEEDDYNNV